MNGVVTQVVNKPAVTGRASWHVKACFDIGGGTMKEAVLNVRSVKMAPPESTNDTVFNGEGDAVCRENDSDALVTDQNQQVQESNK